MQKDPIWASNLNGPRKWYYRIFRHAPVAHLIFEPVGRILDVNKTAGRLFKIKETRFKKTAFQTLVARDDQHRFLARKLIAAQEAERERIATDLHDSIGSGLIAVRLALERKIKESGPDRCKGICLEHIHEMIQDIVADTRQISLNLRPVILDRLGVTAAIMAHCGDLEQLQPHIIFDCHVELDEEKLPDAMKLMFFRIIHEGLSNVIKHSNATRVTLSLKQQNDQITLNLMDDGRGFDLKEIESPHYLNDQTQGGLGLQSIKERAEFFGGSMVIHSSAGTGTHIQAKCSL